MQDDKNNKSNLNKPKSVQNKTIQNKPKQTKNALNKPKPKPKRNLKRVNNSADNDNESTSGDTDNKIIGYDATQLDKGEDGLEVEGDGDDFDNEEWEGDDMDELNDVDDDADDEGDDDDDIDEDIGGDVDIEGDDCSYNVLRKTKGSKKLGAVIDKEDDDDDEGADYNVDENELNDDLYVKPDERRTSKHLFQYERVRILGDRTAQLAQGAKPMLKGVEGIDPRTIAQLELESKKIPIIIIRPLPNGKKEKWYIHELKLKKKYVIYGFKGGNVDKSSIDRVKNEYQKGGSIIGYSHMSGENNVSCNRDIEEESDKISEIKSITKTIKKDKNVKRVRKATSGK
jgi:DNA-directed RNA polymerase subunit K/omega